MAHLTTKSAYGRLSDRINRFPQGAPPSDVLFAILKILFSEREAALVAQLPIKPFRVGLAARTWKIPEAEARTVLDTLADRGILLDCGSEAGTTWVLPPPMAGFFEFSMMRVRADLDQKALAELFHEYINVEEEFVRSLFTTGETQLGRTFVHEGMVPEELTLRVMDYERASWVARPARIRLYARGGTRTRSLPLHGLSGHTEIFPAAGTFIPVQPLCGTLVAATHRGRPGFDVGR